MRDRNIFQPAAEVSVVSDRARNPEFDTVPDPRDYKATLKWWDDYRERKRAELAVLAPKTFVDNDGNTQILDAARVLKMDEFPTDENLAKKARLDAAFGVPEEHVHIDTAFPLSPAPSRAERPGWLARLKRLLKGNR